MKCEACGKSIPNGSAFCNRCGEKQGPYIPPIEIINLHKKRTKRPNGFGTVYQRGKTWTAQARCYIDVPDPNGNMQKQLQSKTKGGFPTRVTAMEALPELYNQLVLETTGVPKEKRSLTLAYYFASYERDVLPSLSHSKQVNYRTAYERMKPLHNRLMSHLTVADLRGIVSDTCPTFYPANDMKTLFKRLFELAAADGVASKELPDLIKLPEKEVKEQDAFTPEEAQSIWQQWESGNTFAGFILLMMTTSMMPGELYKLRKDQIDLAHRCIEKAGIKTKRRKKATIVFPTFMLPVIESLLAYSPGETILPEMSDTTFRKHYYEVLEQANCRRLTPYACRHTTATSLYLDPSLTQAAAAKVLRHSQRMAETYTHVRDSEALQAVEHMEKLFTPSDTQPA